LFGQAGDLLPKSLHIFEKLGQSVVQPITVLSILHQPVHTPAKIPEFLA
jgi:hypothetical protein